MAERADQGCYESHQGQGPGLGHEVVQGGPCLTISLSNETVEPFH